MNGFCPICRLCDSYSLRDNGDKVCLACGCNYKERHTAEDFFNLADWKAIKDAWTNREELGDGYYCKAKLLDKSHNTRWVVEITQARAHMRLTLDQNDYYCGYAFGIDREIENDDFGKIRDRVYTHSKLPLPAFEQLDIFGGTA